MRFEFAADRYLFCPGMHGSSRTPTPTNERTEIESVGAIHESPGDPHRAKSVKTKKPPEIRFGSPATHHFSLAEFAAAPRMKRDSIFRRHVRRKISLGRARRSPLASTKRGKAPRDKSESLSGKLQLFAELYPIGFLLCQFHVSRHMSTMSYCAFQSRSSALLSGQA